MSRWTLGLLLLLGAPLAADISVHVPIDHWAYGFIERYEARGVLSGLGDGIKPFSRQQMARVLTHIGRAVDISGGSAEARRFLRLAAEFGPEMAALDSFWAVADDGDWRQRLQEGRPPLRYRADDGEVQLDFLLRQQTDVFSGRGRQEDERIYRHRVGGSLRGHWGGRVGFRIAFEQSREQGSRRYYIRDDVFERRLEVPQLKGGLADFHEGSAYLTFALPFANVQIGKDEVRWGPAPGDNLGLSNNAPSFDMVRLSSRLGAFKLVSIAGALRPCPERPDTPLCSGGGDSTASYIVGGITRTLERQKYISAHRLEVALAPWIDLGFQEVVVYGDRGPEWSYLNPVMFYWAAQSYLGDKDNLMMGLDVDVHPGKGFKWYAAYVVDDLKKLKIFSDDFANKFSLQTGVLWVDPLGWPDADVRAEYVRIEPWIFTHKFPINSFRHFDVPLGHSLGPNSDRWQLGLTQRLGVGVDLTLALERTRHGDNVLLPDGTVLNVGGDLHQGWRVGDERDTKAFLDGNVSRRTLLALGLKWRFLPRGLVEMGYGYEWGDNVPLPPRWGSGVALANRTGYGDGGEHHFRFELRYGYL